MFVKTDTKTQGTWKGVYGADGYNVINDPSSDNPDYPAYAVLTPSGNTAYTWGTSTTLAYCLQEAASGSTTRIGAAWYSTTSETLNLDLTDGNTHQVSLYLLDWLSAGRAENIVITDASSGKTLDSRNASNFGSGVYYVYDITGHVNITLTKTAGNNCVVSAIFFR